MLRAAFQSLLRDDQFLKTADKQFIALSPQSGEEVEVFVQDIASYSPQVIAKAREAIKIGQIENVELKSLDGVIAKVGKGVIEVKDAAGELTDVKVSNAQTSIIVKGQKAESAALKAGVQCSLRHLGEGDFAKTIACD